MPFPLPVWETLLGPALVIMRDDEAQMVKAGELPPRHERPRMSDDEAAEMAEFYYSLAAGELVLQP